jgi:hypothetical protein
MNMTPHIHHTYLERCQAALGIKSISALYRAAEPWDLWACLRQLDYDTLGSHGSLADALDVLDDAGTTTARLAAVLKCGPMDVCYQLRHEDPFYGVVQNDLPISWVSRHASIGISEYDGYPVLTFQSFQQYLARLTARITFRRPAPGPLRLDVLGPPGENTRVVVGLRDENGPWAWRFPGPAPVLYDDHTGRWRRDILCPSLRGY